jgi:putative salt-induced outer membrane protein
MKWVGLLLACAAAGTPLAAQAADSSHVSLVGDLGFVNAAGNTSLTTLNVGEKLAYTRARVTLAQRALMVYGRTNDSTSASQWLAGLRGDVAFNDRIGAYATTTFERNRFAGFSRRLEEGAGLAVGAIRRATDSLRFEAGATATQQRSVAETSENFVSARAAIDYRHHLNAKAFVGEIVELLPDLQVSSNVRVNSETLLVAPLSSRIAIKLSYVVHFDNLPEPGFRKTDRLFTSGVQVTM